MGLDMYLEQHHYVKNWEHQGPEERHNITILRGVKPANISVDKISSVVTEEIYWRKANAIHKWFVDNVQDGVDNCGDYPVSEEDLGELLELVSEALSKPKQAHTILPTQSGFFFGGTDYDECYIDDLRHTKTELERLLKEPVRGEMHYNSSW